MRAIALAEDARKLFIRPLIISLFFSVAGEFLLLVVTSCCGIVRADTTFAEAGPIGNARHHIEAVRKS